MAEQMKGPQKVKKKLEHILDVVLYNKHRKAFQEWLERKNINYYLTAWLYRILKRFLKIPDESIQVYCIGQSHLDAAWKWTRRDTIRKAIITFKHAVEHIEKYPFFTMSMSSPQYYAWIKQYRPEIYERIKEFAPSGRMEYVGGMWVEPDVNLISGESLCRQRLYGQRFYLEEFGKISEVAVLSDTFGFPWTLPQILVKSGAKYFWTNKLAWNDTNKWPLSTFLWRGPDGSEIFTHNFLFNVQGLLEWKNWEKLNRFPEQQDGVFDSTNTMEEIEAAMGEDYLKSLGFFYGLGDGGAGPLEEEILIMKNLARLGKFKFTNTTRYFQRIEDEMQNIPTWNDELYLEFHRGVYTTIESVKRLNRLCENALHDTEWLASLGEFCAGFDYPREHLHEAWKLLCFNQFHDILPGSSIQEVYVDAQLDHESILKTCFGIQAEVFDVLRGFFKGFNQAVLGDQNFIVVNTLPWQRNDYLLLPDFPEDLITENLAVHDTRGVKLAIQETFAGLLVELPQIPSKGFSLISLKNESPDAPEQNSKDELAPDSDLLLIQEGGVIRLENEFLVVEIDRASGFLSSIFSRSQDRELLQGWGNEVKVYTEKPKRFPAWDLDTRYTRHLHPLGEPIIIKILDNGLLQKTIEVQWSHEKSFLSMSISLRKGCPMVFFTLDADWQTKDRLVKTNFDLAIETNEVRCEIPYGTIGRRIQPQTSFDEAKYEFPALRWVDVSDTKGGVTVLNKSKNGFSATKHGIAMSLLRTPQYPKDPFFTRHLFVPQKYLSTHSDLKFHHIEYALYVHDGDWKTAVSWRAARNFNYPYLVRYQDKVYFTAEINGTQIQLNESFLSASPTSVVLSCFKKPYDGRDSGERERSKEEWEYILRVYETTGASIENAAINFNPPFQLTRASEIDILERDIRSLEIIHDLNSLTFSLGPYEIKTFRVGLKRIQISRE